MIDWTEIDTVFLDMDGTLLDLHFDDFFWREHVPRRYAEKHGLEFGTAFDQLLVRYKDIEGTLDWYCLDFWSKELGMDIPFLKKEIDHLITVHPYVVEFLDSVQSIGKRRVLVTNAHGKSLSLKMERTRLGGHLDALVCAHDLGLPKEDVRFWNHLREIEPFDSNRTLLIDDSLPVLESARVFGIRHLLAIQQPNTQGPIRQIEAFSSITTFAEIMPTR
ncbi:MAG TPA: GMP/IMP nucleotidase [Acidobacteriota bacterium]|nr:GMP/IMP nucleotidase [Acidobacteriota bacterium]